jgi:hypothetical protein
LRDTEKVGMQRVLEALESNDWASAPAGPDDGLDHDDDNIGDDDFGDFTVVGAGQGKQGDMSAEDEDGDEDNDEGVLNPESLDFGFDRDDFIGLRRAIWNGGREPDGDEEEERIDRMVQGISSTQRQGQGRVSASTSASLQRQPAPPTTTTTAPEPAPDAADKEGHTSEELDADEVQKLDAMMRKLLAVRDMSAGLPEEQRKRMAARAVGEVMKEL